MINYTKKTTPIRVPNLIAKYIRDLAREVGVSQGEIVAAMFIAQAEDRLRLVPLDEGQNNARQ
jgi:hypothetical protein